MGEEVGHSKGEPNLAYPTAGDRVETLAGTSKQRAVSTEETDSMSLRDRDSGQEGSDAVKTESQPTVSATLATSATFGGLATGKTMKGNQHVQPDASMLAQGDETPAVEPRVKEEVYQLLTSPRDHSAEEKEKASVGAEATKSLSFVELSISRDERHVHTPREDPVSDAEHSSNNNNNIVLNTLPTEQEVAAIPATTSATISTTAASDRELPAPPTPAKKVEPLLSEVEQVAESFEANAKVSETMHNKKASRSELVVQGQSDTIAVPTSPNPSESSPRQPTSGGLRIGKGPPPTTQASEEKPFDFNRFLDQMRHKSAGPVGEYVRSFIKGFTKKPYRVSDQTKLIFDFLDFISHRMRECEVWLRLNEAEFEIAMEAMEKLLMNRLYNFTFSPAVRREGKWNVQTDDLERDRVLKQRIRLFGWISEEHLDVPVGTHSKGFLDFAMEELLKINHYKAPRDKVICILNCCKVIFGLIRHLSSEENADNFIPILIFVVLRSNPDHLISNVEYISRFRNPERLSSESGYYLSSLMGAIAFIETMDYTSLSNITQQEFGAKVEAAVEGMSVQPESSEASPANMTTAADRASGEKTGRSSAQMTPQGSTSSGEDAARVLPIAVGASALAEDTRAFFQRTGEAARAGIGASLGRPMGALGRLFQEGLEGPRTPGGSSPALVSGRATPDSPSNMSGGGVASSSISGPPSARSRMWGMFGVDDDEAQRRQQSPSVQYTRAVSSASLNFGSWSRNMRDEEDEAPQTPVSEEMRQGRFAPLGDHSVQPNLEAQMLQNAPRIYRHRPRAPDRQGSIDPYSIQDEDMMDSGVRTPDGDGSDLDPSSPSQATSGGRPRFSDLSGFLPSFLSDPNMAPSSGRASSQTQTPRPLVPIQPAEDSLDDEEAVRATQQIEQAHLTAGVETLKSIFPDTETSVCRLVLEGCNGDVQASIDKLLEMS